MQFEQMQLVAEDAMKVMVRSSPSLEVPDSDLVGVRSDPIQEGGTHRRDKETTWTYPSLTLAMKPLSAATTVAAASARDGVTSLIAAVAVTSDLGE